jgi:hypothetical protein
MLGDPYEGPEDTPDFGGNESDGGGYPDEDGTTPDTDDD